MIEILLILLVIAFVVFGIGLYFFILAGSLFIGGIGGLFVGVFKGLRNYVAALVNNLKLRK